MQLRAQRLRRKLLNALGTGNLRRSDFVPACKQNRLLLQLLLLLQNCLDCSRLAFESLRSDHIVRRCWSDKIRWCHWSHFIERSIIAKQRPAGGESVQERKIADVFERAEILARNLKSDHRLLIDVVIKSSSRRSSTSHLVLMCEVVQQNKPLLSAALWRELRCRRAQYFFYAHRTEIPWRRTASSLESSASTI